MKKYSLLIILIFIIIIGYLIYVNSNYYVKNNNWKYDDGYWIGDFLTNPEFDENKGRYEIYFCDGKHLIITNVNTKEKGYYVNK